MTDNRKIQIIIYIFVSFAAIWCGVAMRDQVMRLGGDGVVGNVALFTIPIVLFAIFIVGMMALEGVVCYAQKRFDKVRDNSVEAKIIKPKEVEAAKVEEEKPLQVIEVEAIEVEDVEIIEPEVKIIETVTDEPVEEQSRQNILPETIFTRGAYEKLQQLETLLIKDGYLSDDLQWKYELNGKIKLKELIIFMIGLSEESYFMRNKDAKVKIFFEERYRISIGQNFEKSRRDKYFGWYRVTFHNYPF